MSVLTDPIADMLTRIRNAGLARKPETIMPSNKTLVAIAKILQQEGYIRGWAVEEGAPFNTLTIYLKYGADSSRTGRHTANELSVDSHELIALCAPRLTFVSYGVPEKGDAKWLDQQGSYMAAVAAQPAFRLLGAKTLGVSDDYMNERMPPVNTGLLDGQLAWRQHDGGHTDAPNWKYFLSWADYFLGRRYTPAPPVPVPPAQPAAQP